MIVNDATSWSFTLESSIILLESSIMLLENIFSTGITHGQSSYDNPNMFIVLGYWPLIILGSMGWLL